MITAGRTTLASRDTGRSCSVRIISVLRSCEVSSTLRSLLVLLSTRSSCSVHGGYCTRSVAGRVVMHRSARNGSNAGCTHFSVTHRPTPSKSSSSTATPRAWRGAALNACGRTAPPCCRMSWEKTGELWQSTQMTASSEFAPHHGASTTS